MGKKSIICPICGQIGTLGVEKRIAKKSKKSNWDIWKKFRRKYPKLSDANLIPKIYAECGRHIENIPTKKYERKRNPIFKIYHSKKVDGTPKTYSHYLGTDPLDKIEKYIKEYDHTEKINLDIIRKLILDMGGEIKNSDDPKINKLIVEVIDLKNYLYRYNKNLRNGVKDEHSCPYCEEKISIIWNYEGLVLNKSIPQNTDPSINKKL